MTNSLDILKTKQTRLKNYPSLLLHCQEPASTYAVCVMRKLNLEKSNCELEFHNFSKCLVKLLKRKL